MKLAQALAGPTHAYITEIEKAFEVTIREESSLFHITGAPDQVDLARDVMGALLEMAKSHEIEAADVRALIRHGSEEDGTMATITTRKKTLRAKTATQSAYIRAIESADMIFGVGPAGTGKTYLAAAYAAAQLEAGHVDRIILTRPALEAGERIGFLPGDMKEKVDPYLRPIYDALHDMMAPERVEKAVASGAIEIAPVAFMRGRTLSNAVVLIDEAQNTTGMQMKMMLTRLGENAKMIITGDPTQTDLPAGHMSGLREALEVLHNVSEVKVIHFTEKDVVRHHLVGKIIAAYDKFKASRNKSPDA